MSKRGWWPIFFAVAGGLPAILFRLGSIEAGSLLSICIYGGGVLAAAFLLSWGAEVLQLDVSASLATAALALIAVLPEYAVDQYFAFTAAHNPAHAQYAAANMTGSNRLLIGIAWPMVALLSAVAARRRGRRSTAIRLRPERRVELAFLAIASVYSGVIILTRRLAWYDSAVLLSLFVLYVVRVSREEHSKPELLGTAAQIGGLRPAPRRLVVGALFALAAAVVLASAKPFAEALVAGGKQLGMDEFLLVQWLAPVASEAPELVVAGMLGLRGRSDNAFGVVLSSKVNQWTLLVGGLPIGYYLGGGQGGLMLDARQVEELVLTASQTILGFSVLCNLELRGWEAAALLFLFLIQFALPDQASRLLLSAAYLALAAFVLVGSRRSLPSIARAITGSCV